MTTFSLQRTLLVGLGNPAARTVTDLLDDVRTLTGTAEIIQGLAVHWGETETDSGPAEILIAPGQTFEQWRATFEQQAGAALQQISDLGNLNQLERDGVRLHRPDEVHLVLIANLAESWVVDSLTGAAHSLRELVYQLLGCHLSLTGLLLNLEPADAGDPTRTAAPHYPGRLDDLINGLPADTFDRGCFLVSQINEAGLRVGSAAQVSSHCAEFLTLLLTEPAAESLLLDAAATSSWQLPLTSIGLVTLTWPGPALVTQFSRQWSRQLLEQVTRLPDKPAAPLAQQARVAAQQLLTGQKLAPPHLFDQLAAKMPPLPQHLPQLIPDQPWPWALQLLPDQIEHVCRQWHSQWQALRPVRLEPELDAVREQWPATASAWLTAAILPVRTGGVVVAESYVAAMTELLQAFVEGVEEKLADMELELAEVDRQLGKLAETLAAAQENIPASPWLTLLRWGLRLARWPGYVAQCRQFQQTARNFAHLSRGRLHVLQAVWLYGALLDLYRQLRQTWLTIAQRWETTADNARQALPALTGPDEPAAVDKLLAGSPGPWHSETADRLYRAAQAAGEQVVWEQVGRLPAWVQVGYAAEALAARLREETARALTPWLAIPVDEALAKQFDSESALADWFEAITEQARPFWRFDETELAESARSQMAVEYWLVTPGGAASPLTGLTPPGGLPLKMLAGRQPTRLTLLTLRRIAWQSPETPLLDDEVKGEHNGL